MPVIIDRLDLVDTAPAAARGATEVGHGASEPATAGGPPTPTPHAEVIEKIRCALQRATRVLAD